MIISLKDEIKVYLRDYLEMLDDKETSDNLNSFINKQSELLKSISQLGLKVFPGFSPENGMPLTLRPQWTEYFMLVAQDAATRASCFARKVGAVIVQDKQIIATGYNGYPRGIDSCMSKGFCNKEAEKANLIRQRKEHYLELLENSKDRELIMQMIRKEISNDSVRFCRAQHAERNAINQLATSGAHIESRHSRDKIIESINAEDSFNNIPGSSIFVTAFPCNNCAIEIASTGISKVYYMSDYLNSTVDNSDQQKTLDFLESKNIYIRKVVIRPEILLLNTYNMYHRETISRSLAKPNEFDIEELLNN